MLADVVDRRLFNESNSVVVNTPLLIEDAVGRLNVIVPVVVAMLKSDPLVPVSKVNVGPFVPLIVVVAPPPLAVQLKVFTDQEQLEPAVMRVLGVL